jgi:hypothetical protein
MMANQDKSSLENSYVAATREAYEAVAQLHAIELCLPSDADYPPRENWREVWRVSASAVEPALCLLVAIPVTFPDDFPAVYLPRETAEQVGAIPHLDLHRFICTFDKQTTRLNAEHPGDIALAVIKKAIHIWREGLSRSNLDEYEEEFLAYWEQGVRINALSLIHLDGVKREIILHTLRPAFGGNAWLFSESEDEAVYWLRNAGFNGQLREKPALYLPINSLGIPPYPETNGELFNRLSQLAPEALQDLLAFLAVAERPTPILFSTETKSGTVAGAWAHPFIYHHVPGPRGGKTVQKSIPGFRPKRHPIELEIARYNQAAPLSLATVTRAERKRLIERTSGELLAEQSSPVNIIGCGSVGGFVAENVIRSGLSSKVRLIDHEFITVENVWRHYCGMSDIGKSKVTAVSEKLSRHFPDIDVKAYREDVLKILAQKPQSLTPSFLTISTAAHFSMESRLNHLFYEGELGSKALCYIWVEPYLYAGHAMLLFPSTSGCFECLLDEQLLFKHRVLEEAGRFTKHEAGCQSSFIPYSGVGLCEFIPQAMRFVRSNLHQEHNLLFSWVGDLEKARHEDVLISKAWSASPGFQHRVSTINRSPECHLCPKH